MAYRLISTVIFGIAFVAPCVRSSVLAENGDSIFQAAVENNLAIKRFDVIIRHFRSSFPSSSEELRVKKSEFTESARLFFDSEKERFVYILQRETSIDHGKSMQTIVTRSLDHFQNGILHRAGASDGHSMSTTKKSTYEKAIEKIPCLQVVNISEYPFFVRNRTLEQVFEQQVIAFRRSVVRYMPDGTVVSTLTSPTDESAYSKVIYSASTLMPQKYAVFRERNGKTESEYEHDVNHEEISGLFRPILVSFSSTRHSFVESLEEVIPMNEVGTVEFVWKQFGGDSIEFPDENKLFSEWPRCVFEMLELPTKQQPGPVVGR